MGKGLLKKRGRKTAVKVRFMHLSGQLIQPFGLKPIFHSSMKSAPSYLALET